MTTPTSNSTTETSTDERVQPEVEDPSKQSQEHVDDPSEQTSVDDGEAGQVDPPAAPSEAPMTPPGFSDPSLVLEEDAFDGADLSLQSVAIDGADPVQLVIQLEGQGFPGWRAQYVDVSDSPFAGEPGSALRLVLRGVSPDGVDAEMLKGSDLFTIQSGEPVDGDLTLYLGVDRPPVPYRIQLQYSPLRLEIDLSTGE